VITNLCPVLAGAAASLLKVYVGEGERGQQGGGGDRQGGEQRRVAREGVEVPGGVEGEDRVVGVIGV